MKNPGFGPFNFLARLGLKILVRLLRSADFKAAQNPDVIIANSTFIQQQIKKYYEREAVVVHPPVDIDRFAAAGKSQDDSDRFGFVIVGRQVPAKHIDLAILACNQARQKLTVVGYGPQNAHLKEIAGPNIVFLDKPSDEQVEKAVAGASAFIFPCMDDFGIAPVEALAAGTPVIALQAGGALDYVIPGKTGEFFNAQDVNTLAQAILAFEAHKYSHRDIQTAAQRFAKHEFAKNFAKIVNETV